MGDQQPQPEEEVYKILFLGSNRSGKTELVKKLFGEGKEVTESPFHANCFFDYLTKKDGKRCKVEVWDVIGSQEEGTVNVGLYEDTRVAVVLLDAENEESTRYLDFAYNNLKFIQQIKIFLVYNKIDLEEKQVTKETAAAEATNRNMTLCEVSAQNGNGVESLKAQITESLVPFQKVEPIKPRKPCCTKCLVI